MTDPFDTTTLSLVEPDTLVKGSYSGWRKSLDYDDTLFDVIYKFTPLSGGDVYQITGSWDGSYWVFEATNAITTAWVKGEYRWDSYVQRSSDSELSLLTSGYVEVYDNTDDRRTHAELMVVKIESVLSGRADTDIESYSIKSRSLTRMSVAELTKWRDYYIAEVSRTGGSVTSEKVADKYKCRVRFV